jgi:hypothetical protein
LVVENIFWNWFSVYVVKLGGGGYLCWVQLKTWCHRNGISCTHKIKEDSCIVSFVCSTVFLLSQWYL